MADPTIKNAEIFVNSILKGKNIKATKHLEKILQKKCAEKIKKTLKN